MMCLPTGAFRRRHRHGTPPPPREPLMLDEPRELLARAWLPLMPAPAPPKALLLVELGVLRTCWLPTRSGPVPRFELMLPALAPPRLPALALFPGWHVARCPRLASERTIPGTGLLPRLVLTGVVLPRLHRVATGSSAVLVGGAAVGVGRSATMLRVVLPVAVAAS